MNTIHIPTIEGETEQEQRRRAALAITHALAENENLRCEVAALLGVESDRLMWRNQSAPQTIQCFTAL